MCGIAGWVDFERELSGEAATVARMAATLACRGPDEEGIWVGTHAAFGHRRLIVIDPAGGRQPMLRPGRSPGAGAGAPPDANPDVGADGHGEPYVLNYNGELYNTEELRRELVGCGCRFEGHSDTEVVLQAYIHWGPACVERLNGIFAFAVWDGPARQLFLARDRLGVKPLFYHRRGSSLLFASEIKALLAHPDVEPEVDGEGLAEVLAVGPGRTPGHGVFRGVHEVLPGQALLWNRHGLRAWRYWQLRSQPHTDDEATTVARVRWLLEDALRRQLVSDVPVGTLLSGGLDSSALTAFAARAYGERGLPPLMTFSVDYRGNQRHFRPNDFQPDADGPWVQRVSSALGTDHRTVVIDNGRLAGCLDRAMALRDLPGMADVDASLYLFCREIKSHVTVAISGECADEVFGGYPWLYRPEMAQARAFPWAPDLGLRLRFLSPEVLAAVRPEAYALARYEEALAEVPHLEGEPAAEARMRELTYLNLTRWMAVLLERKDRMSMGVGLEVRVPFCDHRLVEYVWNVPWPLKFAGGREKGLLRRALVGVLPDDVLARKKSPFPKAHDPSFLAAVRSRLLEVLDDVASPLRDLVRVDALREFARGEVARVHRPWFGQLMSGPQWLAYLLQVDAWLRTYRIRLRP
ncbi:MAG TPA: asparagine synthase (glutamine-hydrolyzing) [Bacillota bacterium]